MSSSPKKAKGSGVVDVADTLTAIARESAAQASVRLAEYEALVEAAVAGEPVDPAVAARTLHDAGKSADEFRGEVSRRSERGPLRAKVESLPALELAALNAREALQDHERRRAAAIDELDAESRSLNWKFRNAVQKVVDADTAARQLRDTYRGPLLKDLDAALARLNGTCVQLKAARSEVSHVRAGIANAEATNASGTATLTEARSRLVAEAEAIAARMLTA